MNKPIICLCVDENICNNVNHVYNSIIANTGEIDFYIICDVSVPKEIIKRYKNNGYKIFENIDIPEIDISKLHNHAHIKSKAMYYRWLIPELINSDKVIYVDNDVIIEGNLYDLWNIDLKDNYIAAVPDPFNNTIEDMWYNQTIVEPEKEVNLNALSLCSGQLVINSKLWREKKLKDKLIDLANKYCCLDMIPLNIISDKKVHLLDKEWSTPANYWSYAKPKLWHWHGTKPWNTICKHQHIYQKYEDTAEYFEGNLLKNNDFKSIRNVLSNIDITLDDANEVYNLIKDDNLFKWGQFDFLSASDGINFNSILDLGFGNGSATLYFALNNKRVTVIGLDIDAYEYPKNLFKKLNVDVKEKIFEELEANEKFDAIWMSHVLEHTMNVGHFLKKAHSHLNDKGWLCVQVPEYKELLLGGHVSTGWNLCSLMYNLLLTGFDIKNGHFIHHNGTVAAFVQKSHQKLPMLRSDKGDIESTQHLWPFGVKQAQNGKLRQVNWFKNFNIKDLKQRETDFYTALISSKIFGKLINKNIQTIDNTQKIYFYGAGIFAQNIIKSIDLSKLNIKGFIDGDINKKGTEIQGLKVFHSKEITKLMPDEIIITALKPTAIYDYLSDLKVKNNLNFKIRNIFFEQL